MEPSCFPLAPRNLTAGAQALVMTINNREKYKTTFLEEVESFRLTSVPKGNRFQKLLAYLGIPLRYEETRSDGNCGPHALALGLGWVTDLEEWERALLDRHKLRQFVCEKMKVSYLRNIYGLREDEDGLFEKYLWIECRSRWLI